MIFLCAINCVKNGIIYMTSPTKNKCFRHNIAWQGLGGSPIWTRHMRSEYCGSYSSFVWKCIVIFHVKRLIQSASVYAVHSLIYNPSSPAETQSCFVPFGNNKLGYTLDPSMHSLFAISGLIKIQLNLSSPKKTLEKPRNAVREKTSWI